VGFWSTASVRRHIRTLWAVARAGERVISRAMEAMRSTEHRNAPRERQLGIRFKSAAWFSTMMVPGTKRIWRFVETRAGDRQERGIDTILRCC